jgi:DNA-binding transcriptional LysR family regulator
MTDRLDSLAIFVAVAEHESFVEAARALNRSPAAITRAVAVLEDRLQTRLLNRTTRSVALTEAGARFLEGCKRALAAYEALEGLAGAAGSPRGTVRLTAPSLFGRLHVLPLVEEFLASEPHVDIRLLLVDRVVALVDEGLDIGVRIGQLPDSALRATRVGAVRGVVCASPAYLARRGVPGEPRDLGDHAVISCTAITATPERWSFRGKNGSFTVAVHPRLVVNTTEAAIDAALRGLGLTCLMSYQTDAHVAAGRLDEVLRAFEEASIPIHLLHPAGRHMSGRVRLLLDHLAAGLRARFADVVPGGV